MKRFNALVERSILAATVATGPAGAAGASDQLGPELQTDVTREAPPDPEDLRRESEAAQAKAEEQRRRAVEYERLGGAAHKTGIIRDAEARAAMYEEQARRASALAAEAEQPSVSAEAERYEELAEHYREMGGAAYKLGLVDWAEDAANRHAASEPGSRETRDEVSGRPFGAGKPIESGLQPPKPDR